jgi:hypothetical protein
MLVLSITTTEPINSRYSTSQPTIVRLTYWETQVSALGILMGDIEHGRNVTPLPPTLTEFNLHISVQGILPGEWKLKR